MFGFLDGGKHHKKKHGGGVLDVFDPVTKPFEDVFGGGKGKKSKGIVPSFGGGILPSLGGGSSQDIFEKISGVEGVRKLAEHPGTIKTIGQTSQTIGQFVGLIGIATGQPEIVAAGTALELGGKAIEFGGQVAQKEKDRKKRKKEKKERGEEDSGIDPQEVIGDVIDTVDFISDIAADIDPKFEGLSSQISEIRGLLQSEQQEIDLVENIVRKEEDIIGEQADVINELTDRLVGELDPPVSSVEFLTQLRNLDSFESMVSLINNNKEAYENLAQGDKERIMDLVLSKRGVF